jgi:ABC-type branched-subunit amino acid transport system permease subunit
MKTHDMYMLVLGAIIVIGFFGLLITLMAVKSQIINVDLLNIAMGGLITAFITIVNYFFGSSYGSKIKTEMMEKNGNVDKD